MRKDILFNALALLPALGALVGVNAVAAERAPKIPAAIEGKSYKTGRAKILAAGWEPAYRIASMEWEKALQIRYPELRYCAVDRPLCSLYFSGKDGSCLRIVTRGEVPEEFRVETVTRECDDAAH